ncbi:hypothetical protein ACFY1S_23420 [Micromonospora sp. NPDC000663]|uniref:hypothetical protein n=1 Tax=Micromonospora sp. NPDC000663 TaxID=3364218 RepID=UPI0036903E82
MSRHQLDALPDRDGYIVVVGWDRPLRSYFAQVINEGELNEDNPDYMPLWLGVETRITDPATIIEAVRPYAVIPDTLRADLEADRVWEGTREQPGSAHTLPAIPGPAPLEATGTLIYLSGGGTPASCDLRVFRTGIFSVAVVVTTTTPGRTRATDDAATIHALLLITFSGQHVEHIEHTPDETGGVFHAFSVAYDGTTTRTAVPLDNMSRRFGADITG